MALEDYAKLEFWDLDLDSKISEHDLEILVAEVQLRALKGGIDPCSREVAQVCRELKCAAKRHNQPFNLLDAQNQQILRLEQELAVLEGRRPPKSSAQRALLHRAKSCDGGTVRPKVEERLKTLRFERDSNPAFQLHMLHQLDVTHPQFQPISGKPGWVLIACAGGCGRSVSLRSKKVHPATFYVCDSVASRDRCMAALPAAKPGQVVAHFLNAAGYFSGVEYRWPTPADTESAARARRLLGWMGIKPAN